MSRNVPAVECKMVDGRFDMATLNEPGAYRVAQVSGAPSVSICCPCGCGMHTGLFTDPPTGSPPSMKTKVMFDYPGHAKWEGQLLNGVWTEDDAKAPQTKVA